MTLEIDTSRVPRRPTELRALVRSVEKATAEDEADWIEWKSDLDLSVKAVRATLARHIIGMANRRLEEAHRFAEGFGFILVGVEPGNRCGVKRVDLADLDAGIAPYLGPNGPRWTASYDTDPTDGRSVLVITVDPPQQGDPVHMLRREFEKYRDGDVFVRKTARTERHTAADLEYLIQRTAPRRPGLELEVVITPAQPVLRPLIGLNDAVESWIGTQRMRLLASVEEPPPPGPQHPSQYQSFDNSGISSEDMIAGLKTRAAAGEVLTDLERVAFMMIERLRDKRLRRVEVWAEERTSREYRTEVETYLENCRRALMMRGHIAYLRQVGVAFTVELRNPTDQNLTDVEVVLEFPGAAGRGWIPGPAEAWDSPEAVSRAWRHLTQEWSDPPAPFGPKATTAGGGIKSWPPRVHCLWGRSLKNPGHLEARWSVRAQNLRPGVTTRTASYLVVDEGAGAELPVRWSATATNMDGRLNGRFTARVASETLSAAELLASTLVALPDTTRGPWGYAAEVSDLMPPRPRP